MAEIPPLPEDPSYPGIDPDCLPPKQILRAYNVWRGERRLIHLEWYSTGNSRCDIAGYEVHLYERTDEARNTSFWRRLQISNVLPLPQDKFMTRFFASQLNSKRRYFFTIQAKDNSGRLGPFSDPVSIVV